MGNGLSLNLKKNENKFDSNYQNNALFQFFL
jgi:hypothetical protein